MLGLVVCYTGIRNLTILERYEPVMPVAELYIKLLVATGAAIIIQQIDSNKERTTTDSFAMEI